jgi:hypothetical protein
VALTDRDIERTERAGRGTMRSRGWVVLALLLGACASTTEEPRSSAWYNPSEAAWNEAVTTMGGRESLAADDGWYAGDLSGASTEIEDSLIRSRARLYDEIAAADPEIEESRELLPAALVGAERVLVAVEPTDAGGRSIKSIVVCDASLDDIRAEVARLRGRSDTVLETPVEFEELVFGVVDTSPTGLQTPGREGFRKSLEAALLESYREGGRGYSRKNLRVETVETDANSSGRLREYLYETLGSDAPVRTTLRELTLLTEEIQGRHYIRLEKVVVRNQPNLFEDENHRDEIVFGTDDWGEPIPEVGVGLRHVIPAGTCVSRSRRDRFLIKKDQEHIELELHLSTRSLDTPGREPGQTRVVKVMVPLNKEGAYEGRVPVEKAKVKLAIKWELDRDYIYLYQVRRYRGLLQDAITQLTDSTKAFDPGKGMVLELREPGGNMISRRFSFNVHRSETSTTSTFVHGGLGKDETKSARYVRIDYDRMEEGRVSGLYALLQAAQNGDRFAVSHGDAERIVSTLRQLSPQPMKVLVRGRKFQATWNSSQEALFAVFEKANGKITVELIDYRQGWPEGTVVFEDHLPSSS